MPEQHHSKAYHRYFENYAEIRELDAKGNPVIRRVYVGRYYKAALTDQEHRNRKCLILFLYIAAVLLCLFGGFTAPASGARLGAVFTMLSLIAIILLGIMVFYHTSAPREMEIRMFRDSSQRMKMAGTAAAVCLLLTSLCLIATLASSDYYLLSDNLPGLIAFLVSGILCILLVLIEHRTAYEELPPKHTRPEGSSPIRFEAPE